MLELPIPTDDDLDILAQLEEHDPGQSTVSTYGLLPEGSSRSLRGTVIFTLQQWDGFCRRTATYDGGVRILHPDIGDIVVYFRGPNGGCGSYLRQHSSNQIMVDLDLAFELYANVAKAARRV